LWDIKYLSPITFKHKVFGAFTVKCPRRLCVCLLEGSNSRTTKGFFIKFYMWEFYETFFTALLFGLKSNEIRGHCIKTTCVSARLPSWLPKVYRSRYCSCQNCRKYWTRILRMFNKNSQLFLDDPTWQSEGPKIVKYEYISEVFATVRNVINTRKD